MNLYQAETGNKIQLNKIPVDENILSLKKILSTNLNISPSNIILLNKRGVKLEDTSPVQNHNNENIYVFDRHSFNNANEKPQKSPKPFEIQVLSMQEIKFPFTEKNTIIDGYLKNFYYHIHISENFLETSQKRMNYILNSLSEQRAQSEAILSAISNLIGHYENVSGVFESFMEKYENQVEYFEKLSDHFEGDIEKLKEKELHPSLVRENRKFLVDYIPEVQLRQWVPKCMKELELFKARVEKTRDIVNILQKEVTQEKNLNPISSYKFQLLEGYENKAKEIQKKEKSILEGFKKDYTTVSETLKSSSIEFNSESLKILLESHSDYLKTLYQCDEKLKEIIIQCNESKLSLTSILFEKLRIISEKQSKITKLGKKLMTFVSILNTLGNNYAHVEMIHCLDAAYSLSLLEISRRRKFHLFFGSQIKKSNLNLKSLEEKEINIRKKFTKNIGKYLPNSLIPGFNDSIQSYEVRIEETNLPMVESSLDSLDLNEIGKLFKNSFKEQDLKIYDQIEEENDYFHQLGSNFTTDNHSFKEMEQLQGVINEQRQLLEQFSAENAMLQNQIQNQINKSNEMKNQINEKKSMYDSTVNELVESTHEIESLSKENEELKMKLKELEKNQLSPNVSLNENEIISKLLKENEELKNTVKLKEKLRHETALNCAHSEKKLYTMSKDFQKSQNQLKTFQEKFQEIGNVWKIKLNDDSSLDSVIKKITEMNEKRIQHSEILSELQSQSPFDIKLSLKDFQKDSYCIFIQNSKGDFEAIHQSSPFYFLSEATIKASEKKSSKFNFSKYIIGKIYKIENKIASKDVNPYQLIEGTNYCIVDVEILKV